MNKQEEVYFAALLRDRAESADMLEKPSMRGIKNSVVEKYSDQAHFIYELLQNADDANATRARFILEPTRLIFAHNGTRLFSVSDPESEDSDSATGKLGDVNAITSIANSNKTEASIGKFGVGFKAVFQYTSTPHIYGPNLRFKIERFIVPTMLEDDFKGRNPDETLFVFPFDHQDRDAAADAYSDISDKLRNLSFPLLFLSNLGKIKFAFDNITGLYEKDVKKTYTYDSITAEYICLTQSDGSNVTAENLWLFSRSDDGQRKYSVGFFVGSDGQLRPVNEPAFCFFPTKEVTGLNFIVHAPFLLTDSREGIRAGIPHNDNMIKQLATLAAEAIICLKKIGIHESVRLIADNIIDIIPYDPGEFSDPTDKRKVSFLPFYQLIRETFENEEILPSTKGYATSRDAYWAAVPQLAQLFSNEQLGIICENENAQWVFASMGRDEVQRGNKALFSYIDTLVRTNLTEDAIINGRIRDSFYNRALGKWQSVESIKGITAQFVEAQPISWLHEFYRWTSETRHRTEIIKTKPVFLNRDGKAVPAFDTAEQLILFFPVKNMDGFSVVHSALLENQDTRRFMEEIGIDQPSLKDQIYNVILPQYQDGVAIDTDPHFTLFFKYYCECPHDKVDEFIEMIKGYEFLTYYDKEDQQAYRGLANTMYLPTPDLQAYFEAKPTTRFVALDEYKELVGKAKERELLSFLSELGVKQEIEIFTVTVDAASREDVPNPYWTQYISWEEKTIDGCKEIVDYIVENKDKEKSILLWNSLLSIIRDKCSRYKTLSVLLMGVCRWFYRKPQQEEFSSFDELYLNQQAWIVNRNGEFVAPCDLVKTSISEVYNTLSEEAQDLLTFLNIGEEKAENGEESDVAFLTDSQREKIRLANRIKALGISEADLEELQRIKHQREAREKLDKQLPGTKQPNNEQLGQSVSTFDDLLCGINAIDANKATVEVLKDIVQRNKEPHPKVQGTDIEAVDDVDQDEYMPSVIDYSKRIERAKQKSAAEIDRITYFEQLQKRATLANRYSFGWFKVLLEMESINSGETNSNSKEVSISFARVEREPGTKRTLVLKYPSCYIPRFMEDLGDIPLVLHMGDTKKTVAIEVANIKSYTLRVKLKSGADIGGIDLSAVTSATIDAKSPAFLLEELRRQFILLDYDDDFNMRENLCENIEFVFGPPGTGKTTHLARNVLLPMMKDNDECRVLVLAPTNKAADVLTRRIMEVSQKDHSYKEWLIRFGATCDEEVERVFRDKTFDIRNLSKSVTITTIARFPYDFFMPQGVRLHLRDIKWDYIVVDEASMIPIADIIYPLYKKTPKKFIIAGDPFQIEPITSVDLWKNENIYTLVQLNSFAAPTTIPVQYKVELLTTQYRSTPEIGGIFSSFTYGGILKHNRTSESRRLLNLGSKDFNIKPLNIIKFPVSKYESIYKAKRLQHSSSYQIYSALFTYEYISYLAQALSAGNPGSLFRIGVIAPYRAQADLIDKLVASEALPKEVDVQVGTIHSFQGDECDIIFSVFNPPPSISSSAEMFLNKRNIINVSISRARDYLFIIMPDDNTENIENLHLVKKVERLIKATNAWTEITTPELELLMFDEPTYLENNAFSTSHQSVNVYGLPEKHYEVRTEDSTVDVQIHRSASHLKRS